MLGCAPRRLGLAATSSSMAGLASKSTENSYRLFCHISSTSSCGTLKTSDSSRQATVPAPASEATGRARRSDTWGRPDGR
jgi:hypothetical protein